MISHQGALANAASQWARSGDSSYAVVGQSQSPPNAGPWLMPASEQVPAPSILGVPNLSPRRHGKRPRISCSPTHHVRRPERPRIPWADSAKAAPTSYPLLGAKEPWTDQSMGGCEVAT